MDPSALPYVAWQSDQDAYAFSGQKCSAQSMLIAHENWMEMDVIGKLAEQETSPRYRRDVAEMSPRCRRDVAEMSPRHGRDMAETWPRETQPHSHSQPHPHSQAGKRSLDALTIGPILTWSTQAAVHGL